MSCIYKYKGKDYTKDEFYSLVRTTMVQPKTVQKYEKVLFPTGNTASKVEGHTTLEEFKKQKEDRIKELEKKAEPYYRFLDKDGFTKNQFKDEFEAKEYAKISGEKYQTILLNTMQESQEIKQLKQELERIETEGFGALKPIFDFYENKIKRTLEKQGFNPKLITDEYGNTWNEVTIDTLENPITKQIVEKTKTLPNCI